MPFHRSPRMFCVALLVLVLGAAAPTHASLLTEDFTGTSASGWTIGGSAMLTAYSGIDAAGGGWLRLTPNHPSQAGYAITDNAHLSSSQGIRVKFNYTVWGSARDDSSGDGFAVAIIDSTVGQPHPTAPGAYGGALGYAQNGTSPGIVGGMLGVAFDEYGNFSRAAEGRPGGNQWDREPWRIALRGPGDGTADSYISAPSGATNYPNYNFLTNSTALDPSVLVPVSSAAERPTGEANVRQAIITFDLSDLSNGHAYVDVSISDGSGATWHPIASYDAGAALTAYYGAGKVPANFEIAFTAGTGGATNTHEIQYLSIEAIPEPSTGLFLALTLGAAAIARRRL